MDKGPKPRVDINIYPSYKGEITRAWLRKVARCALFNALPDTPCQLSLVIGDDETLQELNHRYRGLDEVTDVLSFSTTHAGHWEGEDEPPEILGGISDFMLPPDEPHHLGEVIISYPQAQRQAGVGQPIMEQEQAVDRELALLVVHGTLHLLGYDHMEQAEEAVMQSKEQEILSAVFGQKAGSGLSLKARPVSRQGTP